MFSSPRDVPQELDPVTLHNMALMSMEENPTQGFEKLQFLLQQVACPPGEWVGKGRRGSAIAYIISIICTHLVFLIAETFANLLLLYVKYEV